MRSTDTKDTITRLLQCSGATTSYDPRAKTGTLLLQRRSDGADMWGAIEVFRRIDPDVQRIDTIAGGRPDVAYVKDADQDSWTCWRLRSS